MAKLQKWFQKGVERDALSAATRESAAAEPEKCGQILEAFAVRVFAEEENG